MSYYDRGNLSLPVGPGIFIHNCFYPFFISNGSDASAGLLSVEGGPSGDDIDHEPVWMAIAHNEIGIKEYAGDDDNPDVVKYLKSVDTLKPHAQENDETPWCSAFVNWCMEVSGLCGTESAMARSWLWWGKRIPEPRKGCVTILWRESPWCKKGHVGFFVKQTSTHVFLLGGNQSDQVNIRKFPKTRVLGYRTV